MRCAVFITRICICLYLVLLFSVPLLPRAAAACALCSCLRPSLVPVWAVPIQAVHTRLISSSHLSSIIHALFCSRPLSLTPSPAPSLLSASLSSFSAHRLARVHTRRPLHTALHPTLLASIYCVSYGCCKSSNDGRQFAFRLHP